MTIFASTPPINDDPAPFREPDAIGFRHAHPDSYGATKCRLEPRPEYERPRAHPANPILVAFRERETPGGHTHRFAVEQWAAFTMWGKYGWDGTICRANDAQIRHAHRVLQRWRRIFGAH
jgi:hypothetical protein